MTTIYSRVLADGSLVEELPDGSTRPLVDGSDWARIDAMTDEEALANAASDPDNQASTAENAQQRRRLPRSRQIRRALRLSQEAFAERYQIPVGTLRDWEQGRCEPDQPARAYLRAIAGDPEAVRRALEAAARVPA